MTHRALLDDTRPGTATETTYSFHRSSDSGRDLIIYTRYKIAPVEPVSASGPFFYTVHRWMSGVSVGQVGIATAPTREAAQASAREMAGDDYDRLTVDPSPFWWQGAEVAR